MADTGDRYWAGIDWGDREHTLCVVSCDGRIKTRLRVPHCAEGIGRLQHTLRNTSGLVGVAIETRRHLLVDALRRAGITVYPVNPKASHSWRQCLEVNAPKDDNRDAWALAYGLRVYQAKLRPIEPENPDMRTLALLCEHEQQMIKRRSALVCELQAVLKMYFPAVLQWRQDWALRGAWNFIAAFPTPQALAQAKKQKLCGWFKTHRVPLTPALLEHIDQRHHVLDLAADETTSATYALRATALAHELLALQRGIDEHRRRIEALYAQQPQAPIFSSLPGAGPKLAPRLMCIFDSCEQRYTAADGACELSGTVPVTRKSGRTKRVLFRRACRKSYRDIMHQYAGLSINACTWARAFYQNCRKAGQEHPLALRNLAVKWSKIIYRMCCENAPYDEQRYIDALRRTKSPLAACLGG